MASSRGSEDGRDVATAEVPAAFAYAPGTPDAEEASEASEETEAAEFGMAF